MAGFSIEKVTPDVVYPLETIIKEYSDSLAIVSIKTSADINRLKPRMRPEASKGPIDTRYCVITRYVIR